jgi:hypothetical protein
MEQYFSKLFLRSLNLGWVWWYKPVIPAAQEVKIGGLRSQVSTSKKSETLSEK